MLVCLGQCVVWVSVSKAVFHWNSENQGDSHGTLNFAVTVWQSLFGIIYWENIFKTKCFLTAAFFIMHLGFKVEAQFTNLLFVWFVLFCQTRGKQISF